MGSELLVLGRSGKCQAGRWATLFPWDSCPRQMLFGLIPASAECLVVGTGAREKFVMYFSHNCKGGGNVCRLGELTGSRRLNGKKSNIQKQANGRSPVCSLGVSAHMYVCTCMWCGCKCACVHVLLPASFFYGVCSVFFLTASMCFSVGVCLDLF